MRNLPGPHPEWADLYRQGQSTAEIAREAGVSRQAVEANFKRNGIPMRGNGPLRKYGPEDRDLWVQRYQNGESAKRIAATTPKLMPLTIRTELRRRGIPIRTGSPRNEDSLGGQAYRMRLQNPENTWGWIGRQLPPTGMDPETGEAIYRGEILVVSLARRHALYRGLHWPIHNPKFPKRKTDWENPSKTQKRHWKRRYQAGEKLSRIAGPDPYKQETVRQALVELNTEPRTRSGLNRKFRARNFANPERIQEVLKRFQAGTSLETLSRDLAIGRKALQYILRKNGIGNPLQSRRGELSPEEIQNLRERYANGESMRSLCSQEKMGRIRIKEILGIG